jgi:archaellum component FlaC
LLPDSVVDAPLENILGQLDELSNYMKMFNEFLADGSKTLEDFKSELSVLKKFAKDLEKEATEYTDKTF